MVLFVYIIVFYVSIYGNKVTFALTRGNRSLVVSISVGLNVTMNIIVKTTQLP